MNKFSLLGRNNYVLSDKIIIHIPTVGEVRESFEDEIGYYRIVSLFTRTPCDAMVELDDMDIDYTQIKEYELFIMMAYSFFLSYNDSQKKYWHMVFPYINAEELSVSILDNQKCVIVDRSNNIIIDESTYSKIADLLRQILFLEKNMEHYKVPEEETRKYIIGRQRLKQKRAIEKEKRYGKKSVSDLDGIILLLVNNANFKYNFQTVKDISVYDLYACFKQINTDREIDGLMSGYWAGNVDIKKVDNSKLNRIIL